MDGICYESLGVENYSTNSLGSCHGHVDQKANPRDSDCWICGEAFAQELVGLGMAVGVEQVCTAVVGVIVGVGRGLRVMGMAVIH